MHAHLAALALFAILVLPAVAPAKGRSISLWAMIDLCDDIAVARFADGPPAQGEYRVVLEYTDVLKGGLAPGRHTVTFADQPGVGGGEFIAFVKAGRCWRFAATPFGGGKVADSPLGVAGFHDFNTYRVTPSVVTLAQIRGYLKDGRLAYTARGPLLFPERGGDGAVQGADLELTFDGVTGKAAVRGLPDLIGFSPPIAHDISALSFRSSVSTLTLGGRVTGLAADGSFTAEFAITEPDLLSMDELRAYAADPRRGRPVHPLKIEGGPHTGILSGDDLEGWPGAAFRNTSARSDGVTAHRVFERGGERLDFEFPASNEPRTQLGKRSLFSDELVFAVWRRGRIAGKLRHPAGTSEVSVTLGETTFLPLDIPRVPAQQDEPTRPTSDQGAHSEKFVECGPDRDEDAPQPVVQPAWLWAAIAAAVGVLAVVVAWCVRRRALAGHARRQST